MRQRECYAPCGRCVTSISSIGIEIWQEGGRDGRLECAEDDEVVVAVNNMRNSAHDPVLRRCRMAPQVGEARGTATFQCRYTSLLAVALYESSATISVTVVLLRYARAQRGCASAGVRRCVKGGAQVQWCFFCAARASACSGSRARRVCCRAFEPRGALQLQRRQCARRWRQQR